MLILIIRLQIFFNRATIKEKVVETMYYHIENDFFKITLDDFGAELISVCFKGEEKLWQNDNGSWAGHAPVMFPACGSCEVVVEGKLYPHFLHGFARKNTFTVTKKDEKSITFTLNSNEETKLLYPFDFSFSLTYAVDGDTLYITHQAKNTGDKPMYCAFGAHESYALKTPLENYRLVFEKVENLDSWIHNDNGVLTGEVVPFGKMDVLNLPVAFLENGNTAIFSGVRSNCVTLENKSGVKIASVSLDGFDNVLLWHSDGSQMICIEPWQNLPDHKDERDKELGKKKGISCVKAGDTYEIKRWVRYY